MALFRSITPLLHHSIAATSGTLAPPVLARLRVSFPCCFRRRRQSYRQGSRQSGVRSPALHVPIAYLCHQPITQIIYWRNTSFSLIFLRISLAFRTVSSGGSVLPSPSSISILKLIWVSPFVATLQSASHIVAKILYLRRFEICRSASFLGSSCMQTSLPVKPVKLRPVVSLTNCSRRKITRPRICLRRLFQEMYIERAVDGVPYRFPWKRPAALMESAVAMERPVAMPLLQASRRFSGRISAGGWLGGARSVASACSTPSGIGCQGCWRTG